jgi:DNA-binding winged helix-turn-helix (wHTH) protein
MGVGANPPATELYEFGPFRVDAEKELLLRGQEVVPLTPKTFQVLLVLVRHSKKLVTKDDIMKTVWPDTFVEEANLSRNIFLLRKALGETPQDHQYIVTVPGHGYRLAEDVQLVAERELEIVAASHSKVQVQVYESKPWAWIAVASFVLLAFAAIAFKAFLHRSPVLSARDTLVLADFSNTTGDPVFDLALRQGIAVQLEQSPFLSLISDEQIHRTLRLMGEPADVKLTSEIARQICERTGSAVVLDGSIASLDRCCREDRVQYHLLPALDAVPLRRSSRVRGLSRKSPRDARLVRFECQSVSAQSQCVERPGCSGSLPIRRISRPPQPRSHLIGHPDRSGGTRDCLSAVHAGSRPLPQSTDGQPRRVPADRSLIRGVKEAVLLAASVERNRFSPRSDP